MKILFIEDNPEFASIVSNLLIDAGHLVKVINNADDAVDILPSATQFDLIILDIMMMLGSKINRLEAPETGIAIYKRLRAVNNYTRVLVLTALAKNDIWDYFKTDPNAEYFGKPIPRNMESFFKAIEGRAH